MDILNEIKSIEEIENGLKKLLSIDSSDNDAYERMYEVIYNELHPIPFPLIDLVPGYEYSYVYRTRRNIQDQVFNRITQISSIDDKRNITEFGRCNVPNQSTFYCSENRATSNMEVINKTIADNSEHIILTNGKWKIKKKLKMAILVHGKEVIKTNAFIKQKHQEFQVFLEESAPSHKSIINRLLEFFSDYFSRPFDESVNNEYKLSAAFYNYTLNYCDGLIYPSVKIVYQGLNYAFPHERFVENYIELDKSMMSVLKRDSNGADFSDSYFLMDDGITKDTDFIKWNEEALPFYKLNISR